MEKNTKNMKIHFSAQVLNAQNLLENLKIAIECALIIHRCW